MNKTIFIYKFIHIMFVEAIDLMQPYYCNSLFNKPFLQVRQKIHPILKNRKIHCRIIALHEYTSPQNRNTFKPKWIIAKICHH